MQYNLFMDTNMIKVIKGDHTKFDINKTYYIIKEFITEMKLDNVKVFIPNIVLEELLKQYREEYSSLRKSVEEKIKSISIELDKLNWKLELKKNFDLTNREYRDYIRESLDEFLIREYSFVNIVNNPRKNIMENYYKSN